MDYPTIALAVQQPWAWLIVNGIKDVENRNWPLPEKYLGQLVLIHASARPPFSIATARDIVSEMHARYGLPGGLVYPPEGRGVSLAGEIPRDVVRRADDPGQPRAVGCSGGAEIFPPYHHPRCEVDQPHGAATIILRLR